jgi:hypothetical protein
MRSILLTIIYTSLFWFVGLCILEVDYHRRINNEMESYWQDSWETNQQLKKCIKGERRRFQIPRARPSYEEAKILGIKEEKE